jgi:hypothetical protein
MESVRAAVEPLNTAVGNSPTIFLEASLVGLPLINQALAALHPLGPKSFFVTVRGLMQVIASIPINDVVRALEAEKEKNHPPPPQPRPAPTPTPAPQPTPGPSPHPTCNTERDPDQPDSIDLTGMIISGSGFLAQETVLILENGGEVARTDADGQGQYRVRVTFVEVINGPVKHTVHAQGLTSGRISPDTSFNI